MKQISFILLLFSTPSMDTLFIHIMFKIINLIFGLKLPLELAVGESSASRENYFNDVVRLNL